MGKKLRINRERLSSFLIYTAIALWLFSGCATPSGSEIGATEPSEESIKQVSSDPISSDRVVELAAEASITEQKEEESVEKEFISLEPHMLFKPVQSDLSQVLGIDFTMLESGKSRLIVTTDKKVEYNLDRKGEKSLVLNLSDTTILPEVLLRKIDTTHFRSALEGIEPSFSSEKEEVSLVISLKEMVPFHIKQTETGLNMDFGQTSVKPPDTKIIPLNLAEAETRPLAATQVPVVSEGLGITRQAAVPVVQQRQFRGAAMNFDFVDLDVTQFLRAINDVTEENIIWDPDIKGRRVSMVLKNVPWDEALELILKNNDLAKRYVGTNIIWITTKAKMDQIIADEEAEAQRQQDRLEEEARKQEEDKKKAVEEAPLITEYLPVDFATADEIRGHITLTERGTMSIDTRTNTIIIKDTAESIEEAKKTVKQFDTPVKQIMIEARIVDATDSFSRDLGIKWNTETSAWRKKYNTDVEVPAYAGDLEYMGERVYGGSFSTNSPDGWTSNIGLNFASVTSSGLGSITLDASLALAESEGTAKVMSAPKVIAREGTAATISSGDSIIIPATENVASTTLDATLSLTVTPTAVSYNDYITLDVSVTDDQAPTSSRLLRKSISTTLMIKSGDTVVIGGIIKESEGNDVSGFPVLKDVPGLGWLFKSKRKTTSKSELLIFLIPTVLPSPVKTL